MRVKLELTESVMKVVDNDTPLNDRMYFTENLPSVFTELREDYIYTIDEPKRVITFTDISTMYKAKQEIKREVRFQSELKSTDYLFVREYENKILGKPSHYSSEHLQEVADRREQLRIETNKSLDLIKGYYKILTVDQISRLWGLTQPIQNLFNKDEKLK